MLVKYPLKVVLVDDDEDIISIVKNHLQDMKDFEFFTFNSPIKALLFIAENKDINIVFSDIKMDEMYGDELLRRIRDYKRGIQVVVTSSDQSLIVFESCHRSGAFGVVTKPIIKEVLIGVFEGLKDHFDGWNDVYKEILKQKKKK